MRHSLKFIIPSVVLFAGAAMASAAPAPNAVKCELGKQCHLPDGVLQKLYYDVTPEGKVDHVYECKVMPEPDNKLNLLVTSDKDVHFATQYVSIVSETTFKIPDAKFDNPDQGVGAIDVTNVAGGKGDIICSEK